MTDNEIVRSYNKAANKTEQIGILPENYKAKPEKRKYRERTVWNNGRETELLALREKGLTWEQVAQEIGGTAKSVSMHYYKLRKPKHTPQASAVTDRVKEPVKDTPCPVADTPQKTSAFGFENLIAVLSNGEFDSVTFENAEVSVTIRRKAT